MARRLLVAGAMLFAAAFLFAGGTGEKAASASAAPVVVRVLTGGWFGTDYNKVETTALLNKKFNVDLHVISTGWGDEYEQRQQIMMGSGDYPEIMTIDTIAAEVSYATSGALLALNKYWDKYPNLKNYVPQATWDIMKFPDGNIYAAPTTLSTGDGTPLLGEATIQYRADWLQKLGLSVPKTTDEYFAAAVAMSKSDPEGKNRHTYAIVGKNGLLFFFDPFLGAFGGGGNYWTARDGKIVNLALQPGTKDALKFLNKLWNAGAIDPEIITDNDDRWVQKWRLQAIGGATYAYAHAYDKNDIYDFRAQFKKYNPDGEIAIGPPLVAPGYEKVANAGPAFSQRGWMRSAIVSKSKNPMAALPILDYIASKEGRLMYNYGLEGTDFTVRSDGSINATATEDRRRTFGIDLYHVPIIRPSSYGAASADYQNKLLSWNPARVILATDTLLIPEVGKYDQVLTDYTNDEFVKMIVGQIPIDGGYESFVDEFNRRGGQQLGDALNAAYQKR
jgi:ABC-type glycerol-3-phosphate transport system substrate-binding protein